MPKHEQDKGGKRKCEIARAENDARPNRGIKRGKEQTDDRNRRSHTDPGHVLPGRSPSLSDFRPCTRLTFTVGRDVGSATPWPWS